MASGNDIITGALQFLEVVGASEPVSPTDADTALGDLNDYLAGLNSSGGFWAGGAVTLTGTVPISDDLVGALKRALAGEIAATFGVALSPTKQRQVSEAQNQIIAATHVVPLARVDNSIRQIGQRFRRYYYP